jgi:diguanylate cyclase (GGDEF)-like protein
MESALQPASDAIYNALAFEQAQRAAFTDSVTGALSTRALAAQFDREVARSQRLRESMTLLVVSLDNLQESASSEGVGIDQLVAQFSRLLRYHVRETDILARYSPNSFAALLLDTGRADAEEIRRRIRDSMTELQYKTSLSVAIGSATSPEDGTNFDELIAAAQVDLMADRESLQLVPTTLTNVIVTSTN